jgi:hypothetical protein
VGTWSAVFRSARLGPRLGGLRRAGTREQHRADGMPPPALLLASVRSGSVPMTRGAVSEPRKGPGPAAPPLPDSTAATGASVEGLDVQAVAVEPAAPAQKLLDFLRAMGCTLTRHGDRFTVSPAAALDDDLRSAVWGYRWETLALLEERAA